MKHLCTEEEIIVRLKVGVERKIPVYRYRELAVNRNSFPGYFVIYVPKGVLIDNSSLPSLHSALSIMFAVDKLRNNWLDLSDQDWEEMFPTLQQIWAENGYPSSVWEKGTGYGLSPDLNGY